MSKSAVWKYPLNGMREQIIEMPLGAMPIHVALQGETPCVWVLVDPDERLVTRKASIEGTGWISQQSVADARRDYVGTFHRGDFVWHVFMEQQL